MSVVVWCLSALLWGPSGRSFYWSLFWLNTDSLKLHQASSTLKKFIDGSVLDAGKKDYPYCLKDIPLKFKLGRIKCTYFRTFFSYVPFHLLSTEIMSFKEMPWLIYIPAGDWGYSSWRITNRFHYLKCLTCKSEDLPWPHPNLNIIYYIYI